MSIDPFRLMVYVGGVLFCLAFWATVALALVG